MSISKLGAEITNRFFLAIDILKAQGKIRSLRQVTMMYGLNYGNTHVIKTNPDVYKLKPEIIASLCRDFGISTDWMLLGIEPMFSKKMAKSAENPSFS